MSTSLLQLKARTEQSFEIASGTPGDLAAWLESFGYLALPLRNSSIEAHRLAGELRRGERCIVTVFKTGVLVVQGAERQHQDTLLLLGRLVPGTPAQPVLIEQLELFAEVLP